MSDVLLEVAEGLDQDVVLEPVQVDHGHGTRTARLHQLLTAVTHAHQHVLQGLKPLLLVSTIGTVDITQRGGDYTYSKHNTEGRGLHVQ